MAFPSLLYLHSPASRTPLAAKEALCDLGLGDAPGERVLPILAAGADEAEIPARQAIFSLLDEDPAAADTLRAAAADAAALARLLRALAHAESAAGQDLLFLHAAQTAISLIGRLETLPARGALLSGMRDALGALTATGWYQNFRRAAALAPPWTGEAVRLRLPQRPVELRAFGGMPTGETWDALSAQMGGEIVPGRRSASRRLPDGFFEALFRLDEERGRAAHALRERYAPFLLEADWDLSTLTPIADEIDFLLVMRRFFDELRGAGFPLAYPALSAARELRLTDVYDVSLVRRGLTAAQIVPNDAAFSLEGGARDNFFFLTGANGGGKTSYLRALGTAAVLFLNGCPVPCRGGAMGCFSRLFTHFPNAEDYRDSGRFADEVRRAEEIRAAAGPETLAFLNETFSGADETRSAEAGRALAETLWQSGTFGVYVTHIHTLTGGDVPALAAVVDETDGNRRTYRITRVRRTDSSHAADVLYRYGLTREQLAERRRTHAGG